MKNRAISDERFETIWLAVHAAGGTQEDVLDQMLAEPDQIKRRKLNELATKVLNFNRQVRDHNAIAKDILDAHGGDMSKAVKYVQTECPALSADEARGIVTFRKFLPKLAGASRKRNVSAFLKNRIAALRARS